MNWLATIFDFISKMTLFRDGHTAKGYIFATFSSLLLVSEISPL
jgi:hypothetical protein